MKIRHLFVAAVVLVSVQTSCKKSDEASSPLPAPGAPTAGNPLRAYAEDNLAAARQSFTVNAVTGGSITGNRGSHIAFLPGAFVTAAGAPVTGTVQVKLIEVLNIADMILMNKQTAGNDGGQLRMLRSGGEVKVEATQGGNEVFIVPNGAVVSIPGGSTIDPAMDVFLGTEDSDGDVVWNLSSDTLTIADSASWDTTGVSWFYYQFSADSLNWLNCDYFPPGSITALQVDTPDGYDAFNTRVWFAVPALNGVLGSFYNGAGFLTYQAPIDYQGVIVALHQDEDDNYFSSFTTITLATGMIVPITFSPTTLTEFETTVNAL
jgi:hypothetical protein